MSRFDRTEETRPGAEIDKTTPEQRVAKQVQTQFIDSNSIARLGSVAGNMVVSRLVSDRAAGPLFLQRDDTKPATPAQPDGTPVISLDDIDDAKLDSAIAGLIGIVRGNFVDAVSNARSVLIKTSIDEATKKTVFQNLSVAVGSLFLPAVLNVIAPVIQDGLKRSVYTLFKTNVAAGPAIAEPERAAALTMANQLIDEKFAPREISGYVTSAQSVLTSKEFDVYGNNKFERTYFYLNGLSDLNSQVMTQAALLVLRRDKTESLNLYGILKYLSEHNEVYRADVLTRATHFLTEVADVVVRDDLSLMVVGPQLCKINAYGRDRWARVQVGSTGGWVFLQWLDPDAAQAAESQAAGKQSVPRLSPEDIVGHLPDPVLESGGQRTPGGQPMRTEWTNAWGGWRLVEVAVPEGLQGTGEYIFSRWIPAAEQHAAMAKGQLQIGGLDIARPINPDKIRGKVAPTERPLQ